MAIENGHSDFGTAVSVRNRYAHEVEDLESQIEALNLKLTWTKNRLEVANEIVTEIQGTRKDKATPPLKGFGKYATMQINPAVLDVVNTYGDGLGLLVPDIIRHLTAGGFPYTGNNFYSSVYGVARYLAKRQKISTSSTDGTISYLKKK